MSPLYSEGHGQCNCGKCDCREGWTGRTCEHPVSCPISPEQSSRKCQGNSKLSCSGTGRCLLFKILHFCPNMNKINQMRWCSSGNYISSMPHHQGRRQDIQVADTDGLWQVVGAFSSCGQRCDVARYWPPSKITFKCQPTLKKIKLCFLSIFHSLTLWPKSFTDGEMLLMWSLW